MLSQTWPSLILWKCGIKPPIRNFYSRKKIEALFSQKHPDKWIPLYTMVTYSPQIRYSKALSEGLRQQAIMDEIMEMPDIANRWDSLEVEGEILKRL